MFDYQFMDIRYVRPSENRVALVKISERRTFAVRHTFSFRVKRMCVTKQRSYACESRDSR
jgi:hypothetical protein